jgi:thymidylate synthase
LEFKEIDKDPQNLTIDQITKILTKLKAKNWSLH